MSFTAEEVWSHMGRTESVHVACFPEPSELTAGLDAAARQRSQDWDRLMQVRDTVLKSLETARNDKLIGAPLEARVLLSANGDLYPLLEQYARELPALFIVSQVALGHADTLVSRWSAPPAASASAAGSTPSTSASMPGSPPSAEPAPRPSKRFAMTGSRLNPRPPTPGPGPWVP